MPYILIPQIVTTTTALIWVGAVGENVRTVSTFLKYNITDRPETSKDIELSQSEWRTWKTRNSLERSDEKVEISIIHYQRIKIGLQKPLEPRQTYTIWLETADPKSKEEKQKAVSEDYNRRDDMALTEPVVVAADVTSEVADTSAKGDKDYLTKATVTTLPAEIPSKSQKPFTVMLGSCFFLPTDPHGMVGHTYLNLPSDSLPDIKFLCGDQVYLDNPWKAPELFRPFLTKDKFRDFFFQKYLRTWTQIRKADVMDSDHVVKNKVIGGFNALLRNGANYFLSDDHEFWNNGPNFGGVGLAQTFLLSQRRWWFREASELFRVFQSLSPWMTFDIDPISFCIADTRVNRTRRSVFKTGNSDAQFMETDDLKAIGQWINNLDGPGILVMGQLMMSEKARPWKDLLKPGKRSRWSRFKDKVTSYFDSGLPDFQSQYDELRRYIKASEHSIVFLTGDVHYGRLSVCDLDAGRGTKFVEVISSPLSVVSVSEKVMGFGIYEDAPNVLSAPDVKSVPIGQKDGDKPSAENHFVTLEFSKHPNGPKTVEMKVRGWEIVKADQILQGDQKVTPIEIDTITLS